MSFLADTYRFLPPFKGKKRLGSVLFSKAIHSGKDTLIPCRHGLKFHVLNTQDSIGRHLFFDGEYEAETVGTIDKLLKENDVFIDVGANIGAICLPVAKKKNIRAFAFEPARHIFEVLEKNMAINRLENISAFPVGVSDKKGMTDFYESQRVHGWSGMVKIDSFDHYHITTTTLDTFAVESNIDQIEVLKVDVQGWEYFVFKGARRLIEEKRIHNIIFEFEWWAEKNAGLEIGAAQQLLLDKGYQLSTIDGKSLNSPLTLGTSLIHASI